MKVQEFCMAWREGLSIISLLWFWGLYFSARGLTCCLFSSCLQITLYPTLRHKGTIFIINFKKKIINHFFPLKSTISSEDYACKVSKKVSKTLCFPRTLFEKSNFCPKIQFWQNPNIFTSFSPNFFFDNFSREFKVVKS